MIMYLMLIGDQTKVTCRPDMIPCAVLLLLTGPGVAETIRVDAAPEHVTNTIRPTEALGAGVGAGHDTSCTLPAASITVLRGKVVLPAR
jgi:hypothetical protein